MDIRELSIERSPDSGAVNWKALHKLLHEAFAFMDGRIDPPSSLHQLSPEDLKQKARFETLILASSGMEIVGCLFAREEGGSLYVGKLAVAEKWRGHGLGRRLMESAFRLGREQGAFSVQLETRIELTENRQTFEKLGFEKISESAHSGFDRPTSIRMRKELD